ncbi:hypothetical protein HYQ46_004172 [Verticillium longisporum]|nr:hypothetical protein HYQ46_004172 [Verticillium longisporum]
MWFPDGDAGVGRKHDGDFSMWLLAEQVPSGGPALIVGHLVSVTMVSHSDWESKGSLWGIKNKMLMSWGTHN